MRTARVAEIFPRPDDLERIVDRFRDVRVAVVGDFFLDQYFVVDPNLAEPSIETGLVAHQVVAIRQSPGAAGTVVNNLSSLEAGELHAVGAIGDDGHGYVLRRELERRGVNTSRLIASPYRFTPTYTKPMFLDGNQEREGERIDIINRTQTPPELEEEILANVETLVDHVDAVVLLDQVARADVGVLTSRVRQEICRLAKRHPKVFFLADSRGAVGEYRNTLLKPNDREACAAVGRAWKPDLSDDVLADLGQTLYQRTGRPVLLTLGGRGILLTEEQGQMLIPAVRVEGPIDICGAGDSATSGIILALCSGATWAQAALIGNIVASKTVVQIGTTGTTTQKAIKATSLDSIG